MGSIYNITPDTHISRFFIDRAPEEVDIATKEVKKIALKLENIIELQEKKKEYLKVLDDEKKNLKTSKEFNDNKITSGAIHHNETILEKEIHKGYVNIANHNLKDVNYELKRFVEKEGEEKVKTIDFENDLSPKVARVIRKLRNTLEGVGEVIKKVNKVIKEDSGYGVVYLSAQDLKDLLETMNKIVKKENDMYGWFTRLFKGTIDWLRGDLPEYPLDDGKKMLDNLINKRAEVDKKVRQLAARRRDELMLKPERMLTTVD